MSQPHPDLYFGLSLLLITVTLEQPLITRTVEVLLITVVVELLLITSTFTSDHITVTGNC